MRPDRPRSLTVMTALLVVGLTACGSSSGSGPDAASTPTQITFTEQISDSVTSSSSSTTPSAVPPIIEYSWEDSDGYSYTIEINRPVISVTSDALNAKPGQINVSWKFQGKALLTNTTPSRNAPLPENLSIVPAWRASSPLCASDVRGDDAFATNLDGVGDAWCTLTNMPVFFSTANIADQGGTPSMSAKLTVGETRNLTASGQNGVVLAVPESDYDTVAAELRAPTLFAFGADYGDRPPDSQCLLMTGVAIFAETQRTGCLG